MLSSLIPFILLVKVNPEIYLIQSSGSDDITLKLLSVQAKSIGKKDITGKGVVIKGTLGSLQSESI